jgi:hypothetical protein
LNINLIDFIAFLSPSSPFITVHPRRKKTLGASARHVQALRHHPWLFFDGDEQ